MEQKYADIIKLGTSALSDAMKRRIKGIAATLVFLLVSVAAPTFAGELQDDLAARRAAIMSR